MFWLLFKLKLAFFKSYRAFAYSVCGRERMRFVIVALAVIQIVMLVFVRRVRVCVAADLTELSSCSGESSKNLQHSGETKIPYAPATGLVSGYLPLESSH